MTQTTDIQLVPRSMVPEFIETEFGIPVSSKKLSKLATVGGGPEYRKFGNQVFYEKHALRDWVHQKLSAPKRSSSNLEVDP
jgi:hypothetical protein